MQFAFSFCAGLFDGDRTRAYAEAGIAQALWLLVLADEVELLNHRHIPPLYESGIRWQAEEPRPDYRPCEGANGQERFFGCTRVLKEGHADCEDIASWRVAELRLGRVPLRRGPPPKPGHPPVVVCPAPPLPIAMTRRGPVQRVLSPALDVLPGFYRRQQGGGIVYHIVCVWPDGYIEDPSRKLGMGGYA